ncbi:MAG: cupin domain-containing protein [Prevotella sp.]|uniref:cupin domain-containing protein n=1 Tax=Prevotella sp. TaxID=59823 RepID=UPI002A30D123|nr:cupin domain-containing protein [Prevotella sp.]MDD7319206.1 cupin domain-containing protein [Prevotellaceae bacterium]MDY4020074.1 cupin domain-containing protein [Prevotella sp.]
MAIVEKGKVFIPNETIEYAAGGIVSKELVHSHAGSVTLFSFDEGQQLSEHSAPFDAIISVIDGEPEIFIDGIVHYPKAGDMLIMPANHPHAVNAKTRFKMMLIMIRG